MAVAAMPQSQKEIQGVLTPEVIEWRLSQLEEDRKRMADALDVLVKLEQRHEETREALARGKKTMEDFEARVRTMESAMPLMKLTSNWVIIGVLGILSLVGMTAYRTVGIASAQAVEIKH